MLIQICEGKTTMRMLMIWLSVFLMAATSIGCNRRDSGNAANDMSNVAASSRDQPEESPIKIVSARRTNGFVDFLLKKWTPKNTKRDVVLVVEFAGISSEEWDKVPSEQIYLEAGGQRRIPSTAWSSGAGDSPLRVVLVVIVPRDVLEFKLHVGGLPMRTVKADTEISAELNYRKAD